MDFCLFLRSHGKLIFQGKVMEQSWNFTQTVSSVHDVWLWQSCGLHIQVHYFLSRSLVNVYFNVCLVMGVAVRAGHLDFDLSTLTLFKVFNFIDQTCDCISRS